MFFLFLLIQCCSNMDTIYQNKYSFENNTWNSSELIEFDFKVTNIDTSYEIYFHLTYSDYLYRNIIFLSSLYKDSVLIQKDTVNIDLFDKYGKAKGRGMTELKKITYKINKGYIFPKQGFYKVKIEQSFRTGSANKLDSLRSLRSLGFMIKNKKHDNK